MTKIIQISHVGVILGDPKNQIQASRRTTRPAVEVTNRIEQSREDLSQELNTKTKRPILEPRQSAVVSESDIELAEEEERLAYLMARGAFSLIQDSIKRKK